MQDHLANRYSVIVKPQGPFRKLWLWEIQRVPALGVRLYDKGFLTPEAAKFAGEKALRDLLDKLADEERNA